MGLGTKICVVFCCLNGLCGLFIAYLFDIGINSMAITAAECRWDRLQKARACRHAGILYFIVAIILTIRAWRQDKNEAVMERVLSGQSLQSRMWEYDVNTQERSPETAPLLESANAQVRQKEQDKKSIEKIEQKSNDKESQTLFGTNVGTQATATRKEQGQDVRSADALVSTNKVTQREEIAKSGPNRQVISSSPAISKNYGTVECASSSSKIHEKLNKK